MYILFAYYSHKDDSPDEKTPVALPLIILSHHSNNSLARRVRSYSQRNPNPLDSHVFYIQTDDLTMIIFYSQNALKAKKT